MIISPALVEALAGGWDVWTRSFGHMHYTICVRVRRPFVVVRRMSSKFHSPFRAVVVLQTEVLAVPKYMASVWAMSLILEIRNLAEYLQKEDKDFVPVQHNWL